MVDEDEIVDIVPDNWDSDSAIDMTSAMSYASIRSSVLQYQVENGRTYHSLSQGKYTLPNDEAELERLDLQHNLYLLTLDEELSIAPNRNTARRVLDMGTGTGIWAIHYADEHPEAEVIGVDLSPTQPTFVPPNCIFEIDDLEKDWTWSKPFDYIFGRGVVTWPADLPATLQKCYDFLEPGGYLEWQDVGLPLFCDDGTLKPDNALLRMSYLTIEASMNLGRKINVWDDLHHMFKAAGFEDVTVKHYKWPMNEWPRDKKFKTLGLWSQANIDDNLEGLTLANFTRGLGMTRDECLALCAEGRKALRDKSVHGYWKLYVVYGRKPNL